MSKSQDAGQILEDYIQLVYSVMLSNEHLKYTKIEKYHIEIGRSGAKHEFDIFYEVKIACVSHKVAIECKNLNRKITKEMVRHFKSKLDDCNNITGIMVSANGYQEGAKALGEYYGIELITIEDLPNVDQLLAPSTDYTSLDKNTSHDSVFVATGKKYEKNEGIPTLPNFLKIIKIILEHPIVSTIIGGIILFVITDKYLS